MSINRSKLLLFLGVTLVLVWILFSVAQSHATEVDTGQMALPLAETSREAPGPLNQVLVSSRTSSPKVLLSTPLSPEDNSITGKEEVPEPKTGFIFGSVLDSAGTRIQQGRVLVFTGRRQTDPVASLELEGPKSEFRVELPSPAQYWLMVDPTSLLGGATPPLARSRANMAQASDGRLDPNSLTNFARDYVALATDAEVKIDLAVGYPAWVSGRLLSSDGSPISGALARMNGLDQIPSGLAEDCLTDADGIFRFEEVFPGNYHLGFTREEVWIPPLPVDLRIAAGEARNLGDIRVASGDRSLLGRVINQDGLPFSGLRILCYSNASVAEGLPAHDMGSVLASATTDDEGTFRLAGIPRIGVKISLTPDYNPNEILGLGGPAFWEPALTYDLRTGEGVVDVGTNTVDESRPFRIKGAIEFDLSWLSGSENSKNQLKARLIPKEGNSLPEGVRRASFRERRVVIDTESNTFQCLVETPMTSLELHFELNGYKDLVYVLQPEALMTWNQTIRVPRDFER